MEGINGGQKKVLLQNHRRVKRVREREREREREMGQCARGSERSDTGELSRQTLVTQQIVGRRWPNLVSAFLLRSEILACIRTSCADI